MCQYKCVQNRNKRLRKNERHDLIMLSELVVAVYDSVKNTFKFRLELSTRNTFIECLLVQKMCFFLLVLHLEIPNS